MPWNLEIHHIDVGQGDATLIIARQVGLPIGVVPIVRTALIDGGRANQRQRIDDYINHTLNLARVDVMVATHYDIDHCGGLTSLLINRVPAAGGGGLVPNPRFQNTLIFDQGWPENDNPTVYIRAINGMNNGGFLPGFVGGINHRHRITARVRSDNKPPIIGRTDNIGMPASPIPFVFGVLPEDAAIAGAVNQPANWLVGKEIFWTDVNGNPYPTLLGGAAPAVLPPIPPAGEIPWPGPGPAPGTPGGPPAIFCIAANQYVLQPGGGTLQLQRGVLALPDRVKNEKSLAFLIQFNNFRYYLGGDIESTQEDGIPHVAPNGIMHYLNQNNILANRVHAMKVSHHGSNESTTANFVNRLMPSAAFVSCGCNNIHGHPVQPVLDRIQACASVQNYYLTQDRSDDDYNARMGLVAHPAHPGGGHYSDKAITAGAWGPPYDVGPRAEGDVLLTVDENQSQGIPAAGGPPVVAGTAFFEVHYNFPGGGVPHIVNH